MTDAVSDRPGRRAGARARGTGFTLVTQYYPPERGAAQVRLSAIVEQLRRLGHTVDVVTALPNYPLGRIFDGWRGRPLRRTAEDGGRVTRVWVWAAMGSGPARIANYLSFSVMSVVGLLATGQSGCLVIEYPTLFGALPAVVLGRLRRQRVVLLVADLWVDSIVEVGAMSDGRVVRALRVLERWMLRRAHVVTAVTDGVRDALLRKGVDADRIAWLPNGADVTTFHPGPADDDVRADLGLEDGEHLVLYAGTHGYVHGLEVVLDAAERLRGRPIRFLLVGGGSEKPELELSARRRGLDNVTFVDPVAPSEVAPLLRASVAGLATVRAGDVYRTVRSAKAVPTMACGRPVVYSADDEGSRLVREIGAGLVTPPGDGAALAEAVQQLVDDPELAERLGRAGREWVVANASWERLVSDWLDELSVNGASQ